MKPIWIVDDDQSIRFVLEKALTREEFAVRSFTNSRDVLAALEDDEPQVLVSDIRMPGGSGIDLLNKIKAKHRELPVIIMTAYSDLDSAVSAFQGGAFDYLPKPFNSRELLARITAILRRSRWRSEDNGKPKVRSIRSGDVELDLAGHSVAKSGKALHLTSAEFDLLCIFLESPGKVLSRENLAERVLGREFAPFDRSIDLHVSNLRRKLGPNADGTERIRSVRGIGYLYAWPL